MPLTRDEIRQLLWERLGGCWSCTSCGEDEFIVGDTFVELVHRPSLADPTTSDKTMSFLPLFCAHCGATSLHAVAIVDGSIDGAIAAARGGE